MSNKSKLSFGEIKESIEEAPKSWLPALFLAAVEACVKHSVFRPGGMIRLVESKTGKVQWSDQPPTEQGWYWHWNGGDDCAPVPTSVLFSGSSRKCFVSAGQLGLANAIDCDRYGGYWIPMYAPTWEAK